MGLIAKILDSFSGSDGEPSAKVEIYKNDNATARIFNPPGVDARPLDGDACYIEDSQDTEGGKDVLGFINEPVSGKGEIRIVSRDSSGNVKASVYVKADGSVDIEAATTINIIAPSDMNLTGNLNVTGDVNVDGDTIVDFQGTKISSKDHPHIGDLNYNTGPPVPVGGGIAPPATPPEFDQGDNTIDMGNQDIKNVSGISATVGTHTHPITSGSSAPGPTGQPT